MSITLIQPDDFHVHLRDKEALRLTVPHVARQFPRATIMPNLIPAIDNAKSALDYLARIKEHIPEGSNFNPIMTLYLTEKLNHDELVRAKNKGINTVKLYPKGVTTNSLQGVADISIFDDVFASMQELNIKLLVHGEISDSNIDIFEREELFYKNVLPYILKRYPRLKIVAEHITTKKAVNFINQAPDNVGATITPQHLLANRNHLLSGGIKPHYYCLPILKRESDRIALLQAATSGSPKFFLGTDSAPHATSTKESSCGCAGCYSMPYAIEYYAEAFDSVGMINKLSDFAGRFGAEFYGLTINKKTITLVKESQIIAKQFKYLGETITPFMAGHTLSWKKIDEK